MEKLIEALTEETKKIARYRGLGAANHLTGLYPFLNVLDFFLSHQLITSDEHAHYIKECYKKYAG